MEGKMHPTSVDKVCKNKSVGGLGIIDPVIWNRGAYCGLIMEAISRSESMWATKVKEYYLKNKLFWSMEIPSQCSWIFRGLLKHQKYACKFIHYTIVNGKDTSLWDNLWLGDRLLCKVKEVVQYQNFPQI